MSHEKVRLTIATALFLSAFGSLARAGQEPPKLELVSVEKVWDRAPHNAFTDLVRFRNHWYLGFREGKSHGVAGAGVVRLLRSADGKDWQSVAVLDYKPGWDARDAKLNVAPDGRLMLNTAVAPLKSIHERQSLVWFSPDGEDWTDGPHAIGETNWWLWGVCVHPGGKVYGAGYGPTTTHPRTARLYRGADGIAYKTLVPTFTSDPETNETAILFRKDGSAVALVRQDTGEERSLVGTASGDYTKWTFKALDKRVGGPELIELPDGTLLACTRLHAPAVRTSLSWIDPEAGRIVELLKLPSGGDTSYPGLVWHEGLLWVSYYSSHEGRTSIYLAKVRVVPAGR
ncbi:MAG: exo-alpha-sialidase [Pirellulales bacterium]|nr:exo-alpha-sialidase [Pirellulales bacterium]